MGGLWLYVLPTTVHEIQDGFDVGWVQHVSTILRLHLNKRSMSITHDWSMVLLYMVCHGSHQYTPFMLAYIPAPWILWVIVCPQWLSYAYSKGAGKKTIAAILGLWSKIIRWTSACLRRDFHRHRCVVKTGCICLTFWSGGCGGFWRSCLNCIGQILDALEMMHVKES